MPPCLPPNCVTSAAARPARETAPLSSFLVLRPLRSVSLPRPRWRAPGRRGAAVTALAPGGSSTAATPTSPRTASAATLRRRCCLETATGAGSHGSRAPVCRGSPDRSLTWRRWSRRGESSWSSRTPDDEPSAPVNVVSSTAWSGDIREAARAAVKRATRWRQSRSPGGVGACAKPNSGGGCCPLGSGRSDCSECSTRDDRPAGADTTGHRPAVLARSVSDVVREVRPTLWSRSTAATAIATTSGCARSPKP